MARKRRHPDDKVKPTTMDEQVRLEMAYSMLTVCQRCQGIAGPSHVRTHERWRREIDYLDNCWMLKEPLPQRFSHHMWAPR